MYDFYSELKELTKSPTAQNYLALRQKLISCDSYDPYSYVFEQVWEHMRRARFVQAVDLLTEKMPNLVLSPRAHQCLSYAFHELNDETREVEESCFSLACLRGIENTGHGTKESPYQITLITDEHDLLKHFGLTVDAQELIQEDGKTFDVMISFGHPPLYFDITALLSGLHALPE